MTELTRDEREKLVDSLSKYLADNGWVKGHASRRNRGHALGMRYNARGIVEHIEATLKEDRE